MGLTGLGFFIVCVLIVMCSVIGTISESVVCVGQGPVSESKFSENSELVKPEMRETLVFRFHKASSA